MTKQRKPLAIAHRGNSSAAPANTIESIRQAIYLGVDMIELDVRKSKDGVPVLIHNDTLDETTNGKGPVSMMNISQLQELDAGSWKDKKYAGEKIPTLMEALEFSKGKVCLALDLKEVSVIPAMIKAIQDFDMVDDVIICGCCEPEAIKVWSMDKRYVIVFNTDSELDRLSKREDKTEFIREYINRACWGKFAALNVNFRQVTDELLYRSHLRGLPVWAWTVDEEKDMERLIEMGVDAIYSNFPERLLKVIQPSRVGIAP